MKTTRWSFLLVLSLFSSLGCEKETPCGASELVTVAAQPVSLVGSHIGGPNETRTFRVNSQQELEAVVPATWAQKLAIDFAQYTLLGGISSRTGGVSLGAQGATQDCNGTYIYSARVGDDPTLSPYTRLFGVLVSKLPAKTKVKFDVHE
jgi:hypothetical protein